MNIHIFDINNQVCDSPRMLSPRQRRRLISDGRGLSDEARAGLPIPVDGAFGDSPPQCRG